MSSASRNTAAGVRLRVVRGRTQAAGLTEFQALPVPGRISIGSETVNELEVYPADGHTRDGIAFWVSSAEVLIWW